MLLHLDLKMYQDIWIRNHIAATLFPQIIDEWVILNSNLLTATGREVSQTQEINQSILTGSFDLILIESNMFLLN